MSRQHFEATGQLFPCPNPAHEFSVGRLIGSWQWAKTAWSHMNDSGHLVTTWLGLSRTETPDGLALITITVGKFCLMVGLAPNGDR